MELTELLDEASSSYTQESAWLSACRQAASSAAKSSGLPTLKTEEWKYTSVAKLANAGLRLAQKQDADATDKAAQLLPPAAAANRIVLVNGYYSEQLSELESDTHLSVTRLHDLGEDDAQIAQLLSRGEDVFAQLNTATMTEGLVLDVADHVEQEQLVSIVFVATHPEPLLRTPRIIIRAGKNSRLRLIEEFVSGADDLGLTNVVSDVSVEDGASVWHHRIQEESRSSAQIGRINVDVGRDASFHSDSVAFGGGLTRIDIDVRLNQQGAECTLNGLFAVTDEQHVDHHTRVEHRVGDTHSRELYRGILDGRSRGVFNGKVVVHQDAQRITAEQASNNLLLSREAEIDTKPELEIYADDVSCAHGATVGELDQTALFYLRSRGVSEDEARALLTYAFAEKVIDAIPVAHVRRYIEQRFIGHQRMSETLELLSNG